jgi:hypothetical protein
MNTLRTSPIMLALIFFAVFIFKDHVKSVV